MLIADIGRNAMLNALTALLNSGDIRFETAGNAEVALVVFGATAFAGAAAGVAAANATTPDTSAAGGTIDHAKLRKSDASLVMTLTTTVVAGGGDIELSSLVIGVGDTVQINSGQLTVPAS